MKRRCAIYARYSSDLQRESSIKDKIRICREHVERRDWSVVEEFVVADRALTGATLAGRDNLQQLCDAARRKPLPFDCILIEDTSRLTRDTADALQITRKLKFFGVSVVSATQGIDTAQDSSRQLLTLQSMMDEQYLVGLAEKVHRGQEGRVLQGFTAGGCPYGYRNIPIEDPSRLGKYGRPAVVGVRQEIGAERAAVVRRLFSMYSEGYGFGAIAKTFNGEGIPASASGAWSRYAIREMLFNEVYRGVRVWNRTRKTRNPDTGRKVSKRPPDSEVKRVEVPNLRIVPEELWEAAHQRNQQINASGAYRLGGMQRTDSSRRYLFSGALVCGECGSSVVIISGGGKRGYVRYGCHAHKHTGMCSNKLLIRRDCLEAQLLDAIEQRLRSPVMIDYAVQCFQNE